MHILRRVISALSALLGIALLPLTVRAAAPPVAQIDAFARASGSAKPLAVRIGRAIFTTEWPAQILEVYADGVGSNRVAGLRLSGVHFHRRLTRGAFSEEVEKLLRRTFAAAAVEEVDVWAVVPLAVGKGIVVSGDLAKPASRTVFTISVRRAESSAEIVSRMNAGRGVFWDQEWARTALK